MRRSTFFRSAALGLGLLIAAAPVAWFEHQARQDEISSGLIFPRDEPGRKYALDPAHVGTGDALNPQGYNDDAFSLARTPGVTRVALVGDSVSFGSGLPRQDIFASAAEPLLRASGHAVEIYNFSMYGYDVEQVAATLHTEVWPYDPDLVVYAYFTNDHFPSVLVYAGQDHVPVFVGTRIDDDVAVLSSPLSLFAARWSALARRFLGARQARVMKAGHRKGDDDWFVGWLDTMIADARAHDTPLVIYGLAPHVLANPDPDTCGQPVKDGRFCASQERKLRAIHALAYDRGVPFVNSIPWLRRGDQPAYYRASAPEDPHHPNAAGHALLAAGLADLVGRWMDGEDLLTPAPAAPPSSEHPRNKRHGGRAARKSSRESRAQLRELREAERAAN